MNQKQREQQLDQLIDQLITGNDVVPDETDPEVAALVSIAREVRRRHGVASDGVYNPRFAQTVTARLAASGAKQRSDAHLSSMDGAENGRHTGQDSDSVRHAIVERSEALPRSSSYSYRRTIFWRVAVIAAGLIVALIVIAPVRQTIADTIQHFGIMETNETVVPPSTPASGVTAISEAIPLMSLGEAQSRVPFHIPTPSWIPPRMHLRGVFVGHDGVVSLAYVQDGSPEAGTKGGFGLSIGLGSVPSLGRIVIPAPAIRHVTVNGAPAVYAHGAWDYQNSTSTWDGDADAARVSWSADGFTYVLSEGELGLSRDDLIRIAESVHK